MEKIQRTGIQRLDLQVFMYVVAYANQDLYL